MAASDLIRLAVVGWGPIARQHRVAFVRATERVAFVGACNRSEEGRERARKDGIGVVCETVAELVERVSPDAILVSTSIHQNYEAARSVIPFGIPILLEKPPGTSVDELKTLAELADEYRTPVQVALNRLHYSSLECALKDMGGRASITSVAMEWSEEPAHLLARGFSLSQVALRSRSNSIHGLSMLVDLVGPLLDPCASVRVAPNKAPHMTLSGQSERGVPATFVSAWDAPYRWRMVVGAVGRAYEFSPMETCSVHERGVPARTLQVNRDDKEAKPGFISQARSFLRCVESRTVDSRLTLRAVIPSMQLAELLTPEG